jgi:type VI secretion system secreted protein Hcp
MAIYMKMDGIDGEFQDKDHKNWCVLSSCQFGMQKAGRNESGPTRSSGDISFSDLVVTKEVDKSTPPLMKTMANGKVISKVEIHFTASYTDSGRTTYKVIELKDVMISSYSVSGAPESRPMEALSLNYEEIKVVYTETDKAGKKKGNVDFGWDVQAGKPA